VIASCPLERRLDGPWNLFGDGSTAGTSNHYWEWNPSCLPCSHCLCGNWTVPSRNVQLHNWLFFTLLWMTNVLKNFNTEQSLQCPVLQCNMPWTLYFANTVSINLTCGRQWEDIVLLVWLWCQPLGVQETDCAAMCVAVDLVRNAGNWWLCGKLTHSTSKPT
jgi:hypothetical protein